MTLPLGIDFEFRKLIMDVHIGSDKIKYCYQCSRCTDNCPVAAVANPFYENVFDPRLIVLGTVLGYKDVVMSLVSGKGSIVPWGCTVCDTCDTVCPQAIEVTEIIGLAKNIATGAGLAPDNVVAQAKTVFENGKAIPSQPAIERRREQLGLPAVAAPDVNEIQALLKNIGADKKL
ncbi:MAG: 4Fe-4S dicluster domain-containing protein [Candidatus Thorarchaeota archaeon]